MRISLQACLPGVDILARLLLSPAHSWALGIAFAHGAEPTDDRRLEGYVASLWEGLRRRDS